MPLATGPEPDRAGFIRGARGIHRLMKVLAQGSRAWLAFAAAAVLVAAVSITVALLVTPMQQSPSPVRR